MCDHGWIVQDAIIVVVVKDTFVDTPSNHILKNRRISQIFLHVNEGL